MMRVQRHSTQRLRGEVAGTRGSKYGSDPLVCRQPVVPVLAAANLAQLDVGQVRRHHLARPDARRHLGDGEAVAHLAPHAQLLGEDDLRDGRAADDEPEEEGRGERVRVVGREDEVIKDEGQGKVEDVGRSADDVVEEEDAARAGISASSANGLTGRRTRPSRP